MMTEDFDTKNFPEFLRKEIKKIDNQVKIMRELSQFCMNNYSRCSNKEVKEIYLDYANRFHNSTKFKEGIIKVLKESKKEYEKLLVEISDRRERLFEEGKSPEEMKKLDESLEKILNEQIKPYIEFSKKEQK